jgi:CheY-like chemotaxis protein
MPPSVSTYDSPETLREAEGPRRLAVACEEILERELVRRALCRLATDVHEASNGEELLELLLSRGPFDVVVTDGWMPRMSGEQALEAARAAGVETPFVVVIALSEAERTLTSSSRCLNKPLDLDSLRAAVSALLLGPSPPP